jgi:hypothetical protein
MSKMISVASGFQYSVNIAYDLNDDNKLRNFIPTKVALDLLEDILLSTRNTSTDRARVLIGAYGKGKSHIVLMILSILMKKDISLFERLLPEIESNPDRYKYIKNYYDTNSKILPVIISGSNTSIPQAFLLALQRTLSEYDLLDAMPETNYKAAISVIDRWKKDFPFTYNEFIEKIDMPINKYIEALENFDISIYEDFEKIYPSLTAGSTFNPFLGFDVVELYESALKGIKKKGYTGIIVVYDEFSKFLEANITEASVSDTKMLQDFAEKCNRSGEEQLHLILISHKEISNYIDKLPKQKIDGWRGVSERFTHVHLNNNFSQTYEVIANVIKKDQLLWKIFKDEHKKYFKNLIDQYKFHAIFSEIEKNDINKIIYSSYPLHPVSTFILPRLSERIAQNERTLFTFLSSNGISTLPSFLDKYNDERFDVITPDVIFDYFEPLLKKEIYSEVTYNVYILTGIILDKIGNELSLESKIIKTISLMYILEQFEKLKPTKDEIMNIFSINYDQKDIELAIDNLIEKEYVIYLKRSNKYLQLKKASGIDIKEQIKNKVALQTNKNLIKDTLNNINFDKYMYPSRYNDDKEMVRFFSFEFINSSEISNDTDWNIKSELIEADGVIYAIVLNNNDDIKQIEDKIIISSKNAQRCIFILLKNFNDITDVVKEFNAVSILKDNAINDKVLFEEYDIIYEDLKDVLIDYILEYTHPERLSAKYIYLGKEQKINRKAALTELLSSICDKLYFRTPVINNESINRNELTSIANNSRYKVIAALLHNELDENLGLTGNGQEVSIMRSTLLRTNILIKENNIVKINMFPKDKNIANLLKVISDFILFVKNNGKTSFEYLYEQLISHKMHIGLRKGLIPIFISIVFHEYKKYLIVTNQKGQININADTLLQINAKPKEFYLQYADWNEDKEIFIKILSKAFSSFIVKEEINNNSYDYLVSAIKRWYVNLPKYSRELKELPSGKRLDKQYISFIKILKYNVGSYELLFEKMPLILGFENKINRDLANKVINLKNYYDNLLEDLKNELIYIVKQKYILKNNEKYIKQISLTSVIKDWCETLNPKIYEQLFKNGTERCLKLFKEVTNDEIECISKLAKIATDLRIEDWDYQTITRFKEQLEIYKKTAEEYTFKDESNLEKNSRDVNSYQLTFIDNDGNNIIKRFEKVEYGSLGKLLYNSIWGEIDSMGQSISEQEKRQVLIEVLKELC